MKKMQTREDNLSAEMAMMYVLADMIETQMVVVDELAARCGFVIKHELKASLSKMQKGAKDFHYNLRKETNNTQLMIGVCSDVFLQFLKLMIDRSKDDIDMYKIYNLVKNSIPSKRNWDLAKTEAAAFDDLLNNPLPDDED